MKPPVGNTGLRLVPPPSASPGPLANRRIVIASTPEQGEALSSALQSKGAEAVALPTIAIAPPSDSALLDLALSHLDQYTGFLFTSANTVRAVFRQARARGLAAVRPQGSWVCAIGPATAAALEAEAGLRWRADIVPQVYRAEGVLEALAARGLNMEEQRILLPRARVARDLIPVELARRGAALMIVEAYQVVVPPEARSQASMLFPESGSEWDAVLFTSAAAARNLVDLLGADFRRRFGHALLVAIGPVTAAAMAQLGLPADLVAASSSRDSLVEALVKYWQA